MKKCINVIKLFATLIFCFEIISCGNNNGLFGFSQTKQEAKANDPQLSEYIPSKRKFILLDGTEMQIDTAWAETSFTYHNGKRIYNDKDGYNFVIPFRIKDLNSFTFTFALADSTNIMFTNGIGDSLCQLAPGKLYNQMEVILKQKNPDTSRGWLNPIVTDTITFSKIK